MKRMLVVGATGDVGLGLVKIASQHGWQIIAAGRSEEKLSNLKQRYPDVATVAGDISTEAGAQQLWRAAEAQFDGIDAVVISVSAPLAEQSLQSLTTESLEELFRINVHSHVMAAKTFIPNMRSDAMYIGLGGGMADFVAPNLAPISMTQAALRVMYRGLAKELPADAPQMRELMILSMVNGESRRDVAKPFWLTDEEISEHICAILDAPDNFPGPILTLQSSDQVGVATAK